MNYAYLRVSSNHQTLENQQFEITNFAAKAGLKINVFVEETISGTKNLAKRELGSLLKSLKQGDTLICSEISRLGRDVYLTMEILHLCLIKGCHVMTVKDGFSLGPNIQSVILAFGLALSAAVEHFLIRNRTREALQRVKAQGKKLGRPKGAKTSPQKLKLAGKMQEIQSLRQKGHSYSAIARRYHVSLSTLRLRLKEHEDSQHQTSIAGPPAEPPNSFGKNQSRKRIKTRR